MGRWAFRDHRAPRGHKDYSVYLGAMAMMARWERLDRKGERAIVAIQDQLAQLAQPALPDQRDLPARQVPRLGQTPPRRLDWLLSMAQGPPSFVLMVLPYSRKRLHQHGQPHIHLAN